ncbi:conserved protein of unknown function (plasmid) [Cupriavidus taiwanensis]|uniref:Uncharacterized protein n=1 Tax=Cupriavidus taiwanensis TaxID=164546 RepID=A0A375IP12_9BURK|nr:conserved protein of unknown function [Cupriavidus taiwanensis]
MYGSICSRTTTRAVWRSYLNQVTSVLRRYAADACRPLSPSRRPRAHRRGTAMRITDEKRKARRRWRSGSDAAQPEPEEKTAVAAGAELGLPARHHAVECVAHPHAAHGRTPARPGPRHRHRGLGGGRVRGPGQGRQAARRGGQAAGDRARARDALRRRRLFHADAFRHRGADAPVQAGDERQGHGRHEGSQRRLPVPRHRRDRQGPRQGLRRIPVAEAGRAGAAAQAELRGQLPPLGLELHRRAVPGRHRGGVPPGAVEGPGPAAGGGRADVAGDGAGRGQPAAPTGRRAGRHRADRRAHCRRRPRRPGRAARGRRAQRAPCHAAHAVAPDRRDRQHPRLGRFDCRRRQADCRRQCRPVAPQRGAGRVAAANRRQHGAAHQHRAPERRERAPGQPPGRGRVGHRRARRRHRQPGGGHHGRNQERLGQGGRHHRRDRGHCLPDQYPGAQRGGRGGPCRRPGPRLRGGGRRGAHAGAAQRHRGQGDQGADRQFGAARGRRRGAGRECRPCDGRDRRRGQARDRPDGRNACRHRGADRRHRAGQPGGVADGPDGAAERRAGGTGGRRRGVAGRSGRRAAPRRGPVPPGGLSGLPGAVAPRHPPAAPCVYDEAKPAAQAAGSVHQTVTADP